MKNILYCDSKCSSGLSTVDIVYISPLCSLKLIDPVYMNSAEKLNKNIYTGEGLKAFVQLSYVILYDVWGHPGRSQGAVIVWAAAASPGWPPVLLLTGSGTRVADTASTPLARINYSRMKFIPFTIYPSTYLFFYRADYLTMSIYMPACI